MNKSIRDHLIFRTFDQMAINLDNNFVLKNKKSKSSQRLFFDSQWGAHFLTAYHIFLDHPIFGSGIKTFRNECSNNKYDKIDSDSKKIRCNTHPHNIYLEIISEAGLSLFLLFLLFNLILLYKLFLNILNNNNNNKDLSLIVFCNFILLFFPFQTTGSFFSTWNGIYYWLTYAFVAYELRRVKT